MSPRKHALDGGAHWRHLVNTIEPSMCGSDVAFFSNYLLMFAIQSLVICYCCTMDVIFLQDVFVQS